ncbi:hypothetical protein TrCOL_g1376 [Triparma columacea]|uniref:Uncharacterized protein n=1 Tax=Triparma columacea TaxID=722753 RepID=A0A9W7LFG5_9STRA|nr:hypothetical protein TrCOL_g1376 [Triparma columacea]
MANALLCLSLVTATSMVVNDYFDARSGTDLVNTAVGGAVLSKPMASGLVNLTSAKKFVSVLYSILLILLCFLPNVGSRLAVVVSTILTFLYTNQIKPFTFWKNVSCAFVVAAAPLMGGFATFSSFPSLSYSVHLEAFKTLLPLSLSIGLGILHREILMDIQDVRGDEVAGVKTVPVVYGARRAAQLSFGAVLGMMTVVVKEGIRKARITNFGLRGIIKPTIGIVGVVVMAFRCFAVLRETGKMGEDQFDVPSIREWTLLPTGEVQGKVYGSGSFPDGEDVTTSRIREGEEADDGRVVVTETGTRYRLGGGDEEERRRERVNERAGKAIGEGKITMFMVLTGMC